MSEHVLKRLFGRPAWMYSTSVRSDQTGSAEHHGVLAPMGRRSCGWRRLSVNLPNLRRLTQLEDKLGGGDLSVVEPFSPISDCAMRRIDRC